MSPLTRESRPGEGDFPNDLLGGGVNLDSNLRVKPSTDCPPHGKASIGDTVPKNKNAWTTTHRVFNVLLAGPEPLMDFTLEQIDPGDVPELVDLVDERLADLRALRHQLVTHASNVDLLRTCQRCAGSFLPRKTGQVWCSNACRQAGHRNAQRPLRAVSS